MSVATGQAIPEIEARYDGGGYGRFKEEVARGGGRSCSSRSARRYEELRADPSELERLLGLGAEKARAASAPTLEADVRTYGLCAAVTPERAAPVW